MKVFEYQVSVGYESLNLNEVKDRKGDLRDGLQLIHICRKFRKPASLPEAEVHRHEHHLKKVLAPPPPFPSSEACDRRLSQQKGVCNKKVTSSSLCLFRVLVLKRDRLAAGS